MPCIDTEARVVREVYDRYTVAGWSIGAITRWLNEQGVATRKSGARWERSTVWGMLRNPAYRGTACFGKTRAAPRQRVTRALRLRGGMASRNSASHERPRDEWIEIPVPALVDEQTFARAQELLHENKLRSRTPHDRTQPRARPGELPEVRLRTLAYLDPFDRSQDPLLSLHRLGRVAASRRAPVR